MKQILTLLSLFLLFTCSISAQETIRKYKPVTINSPFFHKNNDLKIRANVNNYGMNYQLAGQYENLILVLSMQQNSGNIEFDPLHFNDYNENGESMHLIQSKPIDMFYYEFGLGYNFNLKKEKISQMDYISK